MNPRTQHAGTPAADRLARPSDGEADSGSFRSGRNGDLYVSRREYRHNLILPRRDRSTPGIPLVPALREDFCFAWRQDQGRERLSERPAQRPLPDKLSIPRDDEVIHLSGGELKLRHRHGRIAQCQRDLDRFSYSVSNFVQSQLDLHPSNRSGGTGHGASQQQACSQDHDVDCSHIQQAAIHIGNDANQEAQVPRVLRSIKARSSRWLG